MSLLAIIPARGGSKGIPRKNIKPLAGRPLLQWTIDAARGAKCIDRLIVSTEDEEIADVAVKLGADVPFMRPAELAKDDTPGIDAVIHAMSELSEYQWVLLLQPTSPLRSVEDIEGIWKLCKEHQASSAVSVSEVIQHPYWMYERKLNGRLTPVLNLKQRAARRQDLPQIFAVNGALYLAEASWLRQSGELIGADTLGFIMPTERSADLDTPEEWNEVERTLAQNALQRN